MEAKDVRIDGLYNKVGGHRVNNFKIRNHSTSLKHKNDVKPEKNQL